MYYFKTNKIQKLATQQDMLQSAKISNFFQITARSHVHRVKAALTLRPWPRVSFTEAKKFTFIS